MDHDVLIVGMRDWNNVLPVTEEEWEELPHLFDPSPWTEEE